MGFVALQAVITQCPRYCTYCTTYCTKEYRTKWSTCNTSRCTH